MNLRMALSQAALATVICLPGCAATTPYQPAHNGQGYSQQKLESNRYRIVFGANAATPRQKAQDYVLLRAAELTLEQGYDFFVITGQSTGAEPRSGTLSVGFGGFSFGGGGGVGAGVGVGTGIGNGADYTSVADIVMFKGTKPANDPNAFDARAIKSNLESPVKKSGA